MAQDTQFAQDQLALVMRFLEAPRLDSAWAR